MILKYFSTVQASGILAWKLLLVKPHLAFDSGI